MNSSVVEPDTLLTPMPAATSTAPPGQQDQSMSPEGEPAEPAEESGHESYSHRTKNRT
jgi:hypothetical protein